MRHYVTASITALLVFVLLSDSLTAADAARPVAAATKMPAYRGLAVDRIPKGKIQHAIFDVTTTTTKDGQAPPPEENEINMIQRFESWNSRSGGHVVSRLAAGSAQTDEGQALALGDVIDEVSVAGKTCQRWLPAANVIRRWRCTGVNDRDTAILEHNETGLQHHYRHRAKSPYSITFARSGGRDVIRFSLRMNAPDGRGTFVGGRPPDAPEVGSFSTSRTAVLSRRTRRLISDTTRSVGRVGGHEYVRVTKLRVISRRLLPATARNRKQLSMHHPGATVERRRATHERPA